MTQPSVKLTPNENEVMARQAAGETVNDIAESWGVSKTVVYRARQQAQWKLDARTHLQAVARWVEASAGSSNRQEGSDG